MILQLLKRRVALIFQYIFEHYAAVGEYPNFEKFLLISQYQNKTLFILRILLSAKNERVDATHKTLFI